MSKPWRGGGGDPLECSRDEGLQLMWGDWEKLRLSSLEQRRLRGRFNCDFPNQEKF